MGDGIHSNLSTSLIFRHWVKKSYFRKQAAGISLWKPSNISPFPWLCRKHRNLHHQNCFKRSNIEVQDRDSGQKSTICLWAWKHYWTSRERLFVIAVQVKESSQGWLENLIKWCNINGGRKDLQAILNV